MIKYNSKEIFDIEKNYVNRTRIYLYPAIALLKSYPILKSILNNFLCCSYNYDNIILYFERKDTQKIQLVLEELKKNNEFIEGKLYSEQVYAITVRPDICYTAFESGSYSEIYTMDQINSLFSKEGKTRKVLVRDPLYKEEFIKLLNSWFGTTLTMDTIGDIKEFDIPPCLNQEIINYGSQIQLGAGFVRCSD